MNLNVQARGAFAFFAAHLSAAINESLAYSNHRRWNFRVLCGLCARHKNQRETCNENEDYDLFVVYVRLVVKKTAALYDDVDEDEDFL